MPKIKHKVKQKSKNPPSVWQGPEKDGITQSLLSRWMMCRERFRLLVIEGLKPAKDFNHRREYGQMWHTCEEAHAKEPEGTKASNRWLEELEIYTRDLCEQYPLQQEQIIHWHNVCKVQFPIYIDYWSKHSDVKQRTPLLQEEVFAVPYMLPSGRTVLLRGKWDAVDLIGKGKDAGIYLQENKSKGTIKEEQIGGQLQFDLQTMLYLIALDLSPEILDSNKPIRGIRYNVIRRPLAGGKGSIRKHKPTKSNPDGESDKEFYARLGDIISKEPDYFFMRWKVEITPNDIERFKREFLTPCLEELCSWWEWISSPAGRKNPFASTIHYRTPFGMYNILAEGGSSELDEYLATGSTLGLETTNELFGELK